MRRVVSQGVPMQRVSVCAGVSVDVPASLRSDWGVATYEIIGHRLTGAGAWSLPLSLSPTLRSCEHLRLCARARVCVRGRVLVRVFVGSLVRWFVGSLVR
jgi:hypothetical protein